MDKRKRHPQANCRQMNSSSRESILQGLKSNAPLPRPVLSKPAYVFDTSNIIKLFIDQAEKHLSRVLCVDKATEALAQILPEKKESPPSISISAESPLLSLSWEGFLPKVYRKEQNIPYGASLACGGVAESGTVIVSASQNSARGINFLAENHIVFVQEKSIFLFLEDFWQQKKSSAIHFITGPSRTADIEQELHIGAHGPKTLTIVLYRKL